MEQTGGWLTCLHVDVRSVVRGFLHVMARIQLKRTCRANWMEEPEMDFLVRMPAWLAAIRMAQRQDRALRQNQLEFLEHYTLMRRILHGEGFSDLLLAEQFLVVPLQWRTRYLSFAKASLWNGAVVSIEFIGKPADAWRMMSQMSGLGMVSPSFRTLSEMLWLASTDIQEKLLHPAAIEWLASKHAPLAHMLVPALRPAIRGHLSIADRSRLRKVCHLFAAEDVFPRPLEKLFSHNRYTVDVYLWDGLPPSEWLYSRGFLHD